MTNNQEVQFVEFRTLPNVTPNLTLFGYTDRFGMPQYFSLGVDKEGNERKRKFTFDDGVLRISKVQEDVIEFIRNSPHCVNSPNGGGFAMFEEYDRAKLEKAIESDALGMAKAITIASEVKGSIKERLALMLNLNASSSGLTTMLINFAQQNHKVFLAEYNKLSAPETKTRAAIRKGLQVGVVNRTSGGFLSWNNHTLGSNEDAAVEYLHRKDNEIIRDEMMRSLELVEEMASDVPNTVKGKPKKEAVPELGLD